METRRQEMAKLIKTARASGCLGSLPLVTQYIQKYAKYNDRILDFGCGPTARQVYYLFMHYFNCVTGVDLAYSEDPQEKGVAFCILKDDAASYKWKYIMLSNVVNVQPTLEEAEELLDEVETLMGDKTILVLNYPKSPRKCPRLTPAFLLLMLQYRFDVRKVKIGSSFVYECTKKDGCRC